MAETFGSTHTGVQPSVPTTSAFVAHVQWGPVIAGAIAAAALAFVLHSFAEGVGLAVSSTAPTWRDSSAALWFLSGVYLLLVVIASYGLAGYLAARLRDRQAALGPDETGLRDGMNGLVAWALATLLTGIMIAAALPAASRLLAPASGSAVILAFFAGAAALVGAAVAWYAAEAGGRQRDGDAAPWGTIRREAGRYSAP